MTEVAEQEISGATVVAISGPSFAVEVVSCQPTAVVVASTSREAAGIAQRAFSSPYFRSYTHSDVIGVELGGALKNVMAVATGIAEGLGLGFNARAALVTRGLAEMTRLGTALGAEPGTFAGLAGLGDLVLTCTGNLSRNRRVGIALGEGKRLDQILDETRFVAEGVRTSKSARDLAERHNIDVVHAICDALQELQPRAGGYRALVTSVADRPGHDRRYAIDARKIASELGWRPRETFESGLARTVRWYLGNPRWVAGVKSGEYRRWIETHYTAGAAP